MAQLPADASQALDRGSGRLSNAAKPGRQLSGSRSLPPGEITREKLAAEKGKFSADAQFQGRSSVIPGAIAPERPGGGAESGTESSILRQRQQLADLPISKTTQLLQAWAGGDERALAELTPRVYRELRRLAGHFLKN